MKPLYKEDVRELTDHTGDICISFYMPTHSTHIEQQKADPVLLRNLIDESRTQITQFSPFLRHPDVEQLLQPAVELIQNNGDFWKRQDSSLGIFLSKDFSRVHHLPLNVEPQVVVGSRFYIRPILPLLERHGRFYLLALSQNLVRLFAVTETTMEEIELHGVPASLEEALADDDPQKQFQFHGASGASGVASRRSAIFYSTGTPATYKKDALLRYCQQVNAGLHKYLRHETVPLVLACVDYLFAIYREASSYPHLFPEYVAGSPDRTAESVLHSQAWPLMASSFQKDHQVNLARLWDSWGQGHMSADVKHIVPTAFQGRVETLFISTVGRQWGFFNQSTGKVSLSGQAVPQSQDLMNLAAIYTLANGGTVFTALPGELPENIELAALLRYGITAPTLAL